MRPKEIQKKLGINADRIKLFKREGVFTPENPPSGNRGTDYTRVCNFLWAARSRLIDVGGDSVTK